MNVSGLVTDNLLSPAILCFALGAFATWLRSDLKLPEQVFSALSIYLMLAIGIKGGVELAGRPIIEVAAPLAGAFALGCAVPLWCYALLRRFAHLSVPDAAALAAHYGSVSAVTFAAVIALLDRQGTIYEGYMPALLAVMEVPAIVIAIGLARVAASANQIRVVHSSGVAVAGSFTPPMLVPSAGVWGEVLSSKSIVLLVGGLSIGLLAGPAGVTKVKPLFVDLFQGFLCLFLLDLGRVAASRATEFGKVGLRLAAFAVIMPVIHAMLGVSVAYAAGLSQGGAMILGALAASASYIAAPAAVRLALPEANPGYYLTCSLAITFPFNIVLGLPLYGLMTRWFYG
jgi:hypothetical protein